MAKAGSHGKKVKKITINRTDEFSGSKRRSHKLSPKKGEFKKRKQREKDMKNTSALPLEITNALLAGEDGAPDFPRGAAEDKKGRKGPTKHATARGKSLGNGHLQTEDEWASLFGDGISGSLMLHRPNAILKELPTDGDADSKLAEHIHEGDTVGGRIKRIHPGVGGLSVQIGPHLIGILPNFDLNMIGKVSGNSCFSVPPLEVQLDDGSDSDMNSDTKLTDTIDLSKTAEKPKRLKKKQKELKELEITALEERHLKNDVPRTADEFEKLVRSSPNSSYLWIQYMAFLLSLSDIQKARSIAERALRTINFREENEKLNVWVAYLNLENAFGTPKEESVRNIFERALQYCDPKKIHLALLSLYERTKQHTLANELLEKMSKKFRQSCKVWLQYVQHFLDQGKDDESQNIMKRAVLSLPQRKHIKFRSHAAIIEFKSGDPVRGRTLFEKMLRDYPKRTDLWSIYIDQEIRLGDVEATRALFERVACLSLPPKKMKFLLKKYLEFEKAQNDDEKVEYVKQKALEYVESTKA